MCSASADPHHHDPHRARAAGTERWWHCPASASPDAGRDRGRVRDRGRDGGQPGRGTRRPSGGDTGSGHRQPGHDQRHPTGRWRKDVVLCGRARGVPGAMSLWSFSRTTADLNDEERRESRRRGTTPDPGGAGGVTELHFDHHASSATATPQTERARIDRPVLLPGSGTAMSILPLTLPGLHPLDHADRSSTSDPVTSNPHR